jgi:hypothetical protein
LHVYVYVLFFTVQGTLKRCAENLFNCSTLYTAGAVKESVLVLAAGKGLVRLEMCLYGGEVVGASTGLERAEGAVVGVLGP